jgi:excisionase family DNA binding protein
MIPNQAVRGELLTTPEVARKFRIGVSTVYQMAANGEIPSHHIRGNLRFDSADIDDYLFFSKFHGGYLNLSALDKKQILDRVENEIAHARRYIEKLINGTRRQPMKE